MAAKRQVFPQRESGRLPLFFFLFVWRGFVLFCFCFHQEKKIRFEAVFSYCVAMLRTTLFVAAASAVAALSDDSYGQASPVISWSGVEEYVHIAGT